jgi:hypothetical protein
MAANWRTSVICWANWRAVLARPLAGAVLGTVLAGGYGGLVAGTHFACTGRWDRGPAFAAWACLLGALLGLAVGVALAFAPVRTGRPPWPVQGGAAANFSRRVMRRT